MNYRYAGILGVLLLATFGPAVLVSNRVANETGDWSAPAVFRPVIPPARSAEKDLAYYLAIPTNDEQQRRAVQAVKAAIAAADRQKYEEALAAYDRAITIMPTLGDWFRVFAAGVAASAGDPAEVDRRLVDLDSALIEEWAWRARLRAYRNANDRRAAARLAEASTESASPRRRAEGWRALGELALERHDSAAARTALRNALAAWPFSDVALDAARQLSALRGLTAYDQLSIGRIYQRFGNQKRGLEGLTRYLASPSADPDTVQRVRYEIGRAHFDAGRYADAERVLELVTVRSNLGAEAALLAARAAYRQDREADGRAGFRAVAERFPGTDAATRALFMLGDLDHDDGDHASAERWFQRTAEVGGQSEAAGIAHMRLMLIALARGDTTAAIRRLDTYRTVFPSGARGQQATYWSGRLHAAAQRDQLASARLRDAAAYPLSWYGLRAAESLADGEPIEFAPDPVTPPAVQRSVAVAAARLNLLHAVGWSEAAAFEIRRLRQHFAHEPSALLELAEQLNAQERGSSGISIANELLRTQPTTPSRRLLRAVYPLPHLRTIRKEAAKYGIDPYFMAALIRQESAFNPGATSSAGAMGLMQVMPRTARVLARPLGIRPFRTAQLHNPEINIRIGARFLSDMIRTWGGRPDYVLAAYNAGPSRVARWSRLPEARDPELLMERIPFDETRDYVRVVQLNSRIYRLLYSAEAASPESEKY